MDNHYTTAFHETIYEVSLSNGLQVITLNQRNLWLDKILMEGLFDSWAFITAYNPLPEILTPDINSKRQNELIQIIENSGYIFFKGHGRAPDDTWVEECILILGITLPIAINLGIKFGQLAILHGKLGGPSEIIYCK